MKAPRSLQGRILALVLGFVAVVWAATAITAWIDARHELDELLDGHLAQAAALLVVQQAGEMEEHKRLRAPSLHRYAPKVAFQVFHEGRLVLQSENAPQHPMLDPEGFREGFRTISIDGVPWRVFATQGRENDVQVYVCEQVRSRDSILFAVLQGAFWPMALALPVLALGVWWAVRWGVAPLRGLRDGLAQREPQALEPLSSAGAPSEMVPVVEALNALFGRIATLLESERRFTADAAHELRTPIAAIRAQAQVALAETDAARRRHALQATIEGTDRLARLVDQLLTLSRLEAAAGPAMELVDLAAIARRVAAEIAPAAVAKEQSLELDAETPAPMRGNDPLLGVLVRNLLDNAVRYSPPGALVRATVAREGDRVSLRVEDSGPGISDADRARLGERFFRTLGTDESGSGLGWSIVRRIAATHGLEVTVARSEALGGLAVKVRGKAR
ncbi:MAG TPA: ATP-binding protein [Usitatibacter sp.]|nr:ATP-binding protein [Usitatibacter sp.]